jgi:hypothetical protein
LAAEKEINSAKLEQANADLASAETLAGKQEAIQRIYELTVQNAELERAATLASAEAEMQKVQAAERHAKILQQQVQTEIALQRSKRIYNDAQNQALANAQQLVNTAQQELMAQETINQAIQMGAEAKYQKALNAADVVRQMQMQTAQQAQTNAQITQGANEMGRLANEAQRAASATAGITGGSVQGGGAVSRSGEYGAAGAINTVKAVDGKIVNRTQEEMQQERASKRAGGYLGAFFNYNASQQTAASAAFDKNIYDPLVASGNLNRYIGRGMQTGGTPLGPDSTSKLYQEFMQQAHGAAYNPTPIPGFAEGGYVTGPQQAVIGEGGEPEYVIPASKLDGAMQRYQAGMRGDSMIPQSANVSVNYSGSTVDMGGTSYINKGDVTGIVNQAVNQTLTTLQRSSRARLTAGLR